MSIAAIPAVMASVLSMARVTGAVHSVFNINIIILAAEILFFKAVAPFAMIVFSHVFTPL
jgi:hypothetical protein